MNEQQRKVKEFHLKMGHSIGVQSNPRLVDIELRWKLIAEEFSELWTALENNDIVAVIDALCDLMYVINGAALTWGIDLEPFFNEVHASNMLKKGHIRRSDGKIGKPEGWEPPRIAMLLKEQISGVSDFSEEKTDPYFKALRNYQERETK
jgi:predicted HAD superfamily Cof-like phosphohydrolase